MVGEMYNNWCRVWWATEYSITEGELATGLLHSWVFYFSYLAHL